MRKNKLYLIDSEEDNIEIFRQERVNKKTVIERNKFKLIKCRSKMGQTQQ